MAEEGGGMVKDSDFLAWAVGLVVVLSVIVALFSALASIGVDLSDPKGSLETLRARLEGQAFSDDTPLGTLVETIRETEVWERAGGGNLLGVHKTGVHGVLVGGPVTLDGMRWWNVDFDNDPDGWVEESRLRIRETGFSLFYKILSITWKRLAVALSFLALVGIVYSVIRINQLRKEEAEALKIPELAAFVPESPEPQNEKWDRVIDLVNGASPNDWRQAVIEADIMLDEMVSKMIFTGDTLGEKLKAIEPSDFTTLDAAWEAHKVRNRIAHDGGDFILTQREARRIVGLFEEVFNEFQLI